MLFVATTVIAPSVASTAGRTGPVKLDGRALADDGGPFPGLGASFFWALWGERHDPGRLDRNLGWLAARGVDYVRIVGMVGTESWADRRIDPNDPEYWPTVDKLFARLARHGLRAQVTIFADAQVMMPKPSDRQTFADAWARRAAQDPARVLLLEVANEYRQNGVADVAELRALGRRLAERTGTLVALSAPAPANACTLYAGSSADVATVHYSRSAKGDPWAPVRGPWSWPGNYDKACRGRLPVPVNNEPIGPESSVQSDDDPVRLVMAYVTSFVAGNAAYVLHAGAGIRGGGSGDRVLGRSANFSETSNLDAALSGIQRVRTRLPPDLANWTRHDARSARHPFLGFDRAMTDGALGESYAATSGNQFVVAVLDVRRKLEVRAREACVVEALHPLTGAVIVRKELARGQTLALAGAEAFVLIGRRR
jgi:hypothetical protein